MVIADIDVAPIEKATLKTFYCDYVFIFKNLAANYRFDCYNNLMIIK